MPGNASTEKVLSLDLLRGGKKEFEQDPVEEKKPRGWAAGTLWYLGLGCRKGIVLGRSRSHWLCFQMLSNSSNVICTACFSAARTSSRLT